MTRLEKLRIQVDESGVPLRELGTLTKHFIKGGVAYSRICDAFRGWVELKDEELTAIETAVNLALQTRVERFSRLLNEYPLQHATA